MGKKKKTVFVPRWPTWFKYKTEDISCLSEIDEPLIDELCHSLGFSSWQGADRITPNQVPHFDLIFPVGMPVIIGLLYYVVERQRLHRKNGNWDMSPSEKKVIEHNTLFLTCNMVAGGLGYEAGAAIGAKLVKVTFLLLHIVPHTWLAHLIVAVLASLASAACEVATIAADEKLKYGKIKSNLAKDFVVSFVATMIWYGMSLLPMPAVEKKALQQSINVGLSMAYTFVALIIVSRMAHYKPASFKSTRVIKSQCTSFRFFKSKRNAVDKRPPISPEPGLCPEGRVCLIK